ncbi:hypothetical protein GALL_236610 [mine drainage metagenome]|uniref:Uncharacterized protein n=1 Tax=mine drainage metagenome TaxID=410659 RepID=A0A1J5RE93_9ZZZZ
MRFMEREVYKMRPSCPNHEIDPRNRYRLGKYQAVAIQVDLQIDLFANREGQEYARLSKLWLFIESQVRQAWLAASGH